MTTMRRLSIAIFLFTITSATFASGMHTAAPRDSHDDAVGSFNDGLRYRDRAWKAEKELATTTDAAKREKLVQAIRKSYEADIHSQRDAINRDPRLFQAHTELGYALRKTGDYPASLASYDRALQLKPNYAEAVEYRAEAYLALNRVDDAREAYLLLFNGGATSQAQTLGDAMQSWVSARKTDPAGVTPDALDQMTKWLAQRAEISQHAGASTSGSWR